MGLITAAILLGIAILNAFREKNIYNLMTVFCFYWSSACFIAIFRPYEINKVSGSTFSIILIGCLGFSAGYIFRNSKQYREIRFKRQLQQNVSYEFKRMPIFILAAFTAFYGLFKSFVISRLVSTGVDYSSVRNLYAAADTRVIFGVFDNIVNVFVYLPGVFVLTAVAIIDFFVKKRNKFIFICAIISVVTNMYITSGRFILLAIIADIIYMLIFYNRKETVMLRLKKVNKKVKLLIVLSIVAIFVLTNVRFNDSFQARGVTTSSHFVLYYMGCVPLMDHWIDVIQSQESITYGMASIHGFVHPIVLLLKLIGMPEPTLYSYTTDLVENMQTFIYVSSDRALNAFSSIFLYLYLDMRVFGVFIGMIIYGVICANVYNNIKEKINVRTMMMFMLIMQGFTQVMVRWPFYRGPYVVAIFYSLLLVKRKYESEE